MKRLTTEEFIEKAKAIHGDRYDYSSVNYVNAHTRVTIICAEHGPFPQTPDSHLNERGCPDCGGSKQLTTETFIAKAIALHGNRYDYSSVNYVNAHTHVMIICPDHGPFPQTPSNHLFEMGCPDCGGRKQLTTETFIEKAIALHGDHYDYSSVNYVNNRTNVTIICPDHGSFEQSPGSHLNKSGCPDCGAMAAALSRRLTTEEFIDKAKAAHGDRYDYSQVEYVNSQTKVTIICPDHGPFEQAPGNHLFKMGCPDCGGRKPLTTETFIHKAKAVHGDRFDYSQVEYVNNKTKVTIICPDHGPFEQVPGNHTFGKGCTVCGAKATAMSRQGTTDEFIDKAKAVHGDRYDYSQVEYVGAKMKVTIICPHHGPFEQAPGNHLSKMSCPDCAESGFNPSEPGILYYIAVTTDDGDTRYKIGITNRTVEDRFRREDSTRIRIVRTWRYAIGRAAAEREAEILSQYAGDKYNGPDILLSGNTELFTHDILGLDNQDEKKY